MGDVMTVGHTPGPWSVVEGEIVAMEDEGPHVVGVVFRTEGWNSGEPVETEDQANACLIGAAPIGLELAREFLAFARSGQGFTYPLGSLQKLEQFIAAATGSAGE